LADSAGVAPRLDAREFQWSDGFGSLMICSKTAAKTGGRLFPASVFARQVKGMSGWKASPSKVASFFPRITDVFRTRAVKALSKVARFRIQSIGGHADFKR
jgi:hypothetical protein